MSDLAANFGHAMWSILVESAGWVLVSLAAGGLVHEFLPSSRFRRWLGGGGLRASAGAVALGATLPICSCGVIPLSVSLYRSGVPLAPVMAFTAATPIINPAAVILSLALLGPHITAAYVLLGLTLPFLLGALAERFGEQTATDTGGEPATNERGCCSSACAAPQPAPWPRRALAGLRWGLLELGPSIGFYLAVGLVLAGALAALVPGDWIERFLGDGSMAGLLAAGVLGATIYVCAVAHIPVVATLLAAGAGPGAAIVFLVTGTATNLPELYALYRTIGRRTVLVYVATLVVASVIAGVLVNIWLGAGFAPSFDPLASLTLVERADQLWVSWPAAFNAAAAVGVLALAAGGTWLRLRPLLSRRRADCCAGVSEADELRP